MARITLTAGFVAQATGAAIAAGSPAVEFSAVSIDTRTLTAGALFVAIRGERFDGHDFVPLAIERGAAGVLVSTAPATAGDAVVLQVPDTLIALQALGHDIRRRSGARVIAITGSSGKTSTKEMLAAMLRARYADVFRTEGNLNNHIGVPLSLIELRHGATIAVIELGMNHPGEIRQLVGLAEPEVRVWTNVGDAHIGHFGSREAVAAAKAEILEQSTSDTVLFVNADDPLVMTHATGFSGRVVRFGIHAPADVRATIVDDFGIDGARADVETPAGPLALRLHLPAQVHLSNVVAAVAVAVDAGVALDDIARVTSTFRPVQRRGNVVSLRDDARVVDDSYNANPSAVQAMLTALSQTATAGRRILVLGEMRELGDQARSLHQATGRAAVAAGIDELVLIGGPDVDACGDGAADAGLSRMRIHRFATSESAASAVSELIGPGDLVLVKGSRSTRTDIVADRLVRDLGAA